MKKTLIALAAVAVTSTAFAQVTISGRLDMGTVNTKTTEFEPGKAGQAEYNGTTGSRTLAGANGTKTGSRITFAGTEDLGGGTTAFFNIESSLNNSTIGNRNLFAGVRGGFGSVQIGRYLNTYSAIRDSHYSIAGGAGGAFLNQHLNFASSGLLDNESVASLFGFDRLPTMSETININTGDLSNGTNIADFDAIMADLDANTAIYVEANGTIKVPAGANEGEQAGATTVGAYNAGVRAANAARAAELRLLLSNGLANRSNNTLAYTSPAINGFTATVGISNDKFERVDDSADFKNSKNQFKTKGQSLSLAYAAGPLAARVTTGSGTITTQAQIYLPRYDNYEGRNTGSARNGESMAKSTDTAMMVSYDFGVAQAYIMNNKTKANLVKFRGADNIDGTGTTTSATEIGVKVPMGSVEPFVTLGNGSIKTNAEGEQTVGIKTSAYQLGANYSLSKRTVLYVSTGQTQLKIQDSTVKTTGYTAGLVHNF